MDSTKDLRKWSKINEIIECERYSTDSKWNELIFLNCGIPKIGPILIDFEYSKKKVPPRFELGLQDSESWVLTITPWDHMFCEQIIYIYIFIYYLELWKVNHGVIRTILNTSSYSIMHLVCWYASYFKGMQEFEMFSLFVYLNNS